MFCKHKNKKKMKRKSKSFGVKKKDFLEKKKFIAEKRKSFFLLLFAGNSFVFEAIEL